MSSHDRPTVLFAGGCHIAGYPIGEDASFPALVGRALEPYAPIRAVCSSYLKLAHRRRVAAACRDANPGVLILQFGHPELNKRLSDYLRARLHLGSARVESPSSDSAPLSDPGACLPSRSEWWNRSKAVVDCWLGHPLVDFARFEALWEHLLAEIEGFGIEKIVLLSPFPCVDPLVMYYRRRGGTVIAEVARRYGHTYVDVLDAIPSNGAGAFRRGFYADAYHLGLRGHEAIASVLSECLAEVLV